jgi:hypothetical protein
MSFDLRIRFAGLCLLVPDRRPHKPQRLHVLLPDVKHDHPHGDQPHAPAGGEPDHPNGSHPHPHPEGEPGTSAPAAGGAAQPIVPHLPRLIYDMAFQDEHAKEFTRELACRDVGGLILEFLGMGDPIDLHLPGEIADLEPLVKSKTELERFVDEDAPGERLATRITLDRGCVTDYLLGVQAHLRSRKPNEEEEEPDPPAEEEKKVNAPRLTAMVEWTLRGVEGDSLVLPRRGLNGAAAGDEIKLFPIGQTIHLEIWNVPKHELPGSPNRGAAGTDHFAAFFDLVPAEDKRIPVTQALQFPPKSGCFSPQERRDLGSPVAPNTLQCMNGQVRLP